MIERVRYKYESIIVWHAVFHRQKRWWGRKYSHVSLIGHAEETWIHLDLHRTGVSVTAIYHFNTVTNFLEDFLATCDVVRVPKSPVASRNFFLPMTCVSFAKHVIGVRSSALRPDGLFRNLIQDHGGVWINENTGGDGDRRSARSEGSGRAQ